MGKLILLALAGAAVAAAAAQARSGCGREGWEVDPALLSVDPAEAASALSPDGRELGMRLAGRVTHFAWDPEGARIAFRADQDGSGRYALYVVAHDGSDGRRVPFGSGPSESVSARFRWEEGGTRISAVTEYRTIDGRTCPHRLESAAAPGRVGHRQP